MNADDLGIEFSADYDEQVTDASGWDHDAWLVTLVRDEHSMSFTYRMGLGFGQREPQLAGVLESIQSDSRSLSEGSFEDWADALGYDRDSRRAEQTYREVRKQDRHIRRLLGDDYAAFLDAEEIE